jgi:hypothetical protein
VTSTNLAFGPVSGGNRTGTMKVTVRNGGPSPAPFRIGFQLPTYAVKVSRPAGCTSEAYPTIVAVQCVGGRLDVGATRTLTFTYRAPAGDTTVDYLPGVTVTVGEGMGDPVPDNDQADFKITFG